VRGDGTIAVVGTTPISGGTNFAVAQFTASGQLDTAFNGTGMATLRVGRDGEDVAQAVTFLGPDDLVLGGYSTVFGIRQFALAAFQTTGAHAPCAGDCDGDGTVSVNELLTLVNLALGSAELSACPAGDVNADGQVTISDLLAAVDAALMGCAAS
jgi:hypothetical protein